MLRFGSSRYASPPLAAAWMARFTAAISLAEVTVVVAMEKGPETGRTKGLKAARLDNSGPRQTNEGVAPGQLRPRHAYAGLVIVGRRLARCLRPPVRQRNVAHSLARNVQMRP